MKKSFQYSVLYYSHSSFTQERIIIGLLFFFPEDREIAILSPRSLQKLKVFQYGFESSFIRKAFNRFSYKAKWLTTQWGSESIDFIKNFSDIINFEFIIPDSSSIQFSDIKSGIIPESKEKTVEYYSSVYFKNYESNAPHDKIDESKIIDKFSKILTRRNPNFAKYIKSDVKISGQFFEEKFKFEWQNGKRNYITSLSFDLDKEENIKKKSQQQIGVLSNLKDIISNSNSNIHFLVAKPSNDSLYKAYTNAVAILESYKQEIGRVIEYNQLDEYVEEVVNTAKVL